MTKHIFLFAFIFLATSTSFALDRDKQWQGDKYHHNSAPQRQTSKKYVNAVPFRDKDDVLDLGCGDGRATAGIAQRIPNGTVTGLDFSKNMIAFAQKTFPSNEHKNLSFVIGDSASFALQKKFDWIVSFNSMHWVKNQRSVLESAKKHLKPDGKIYFLFVNKWGLCPYQEAINATIYSNKWKQYFVGFDPGYTQHSIDQYQEDLIKLGFSPQRTALYPKSLPFKDEKHLYEWLSAWMPFLQPLPESKRADFKKDFVAEFLKLDTRTPDGKIYMRLYFTEILASLA